MPDSLTITQKRKKFTGFRESHAFVIGINQYPEVDKPLLSCVPDAWQLANILWDKQGFDHVWLLINPGFEEMKTLLDWLKNKERANAFPLELNAEIKNKSKATSVRKKLMHEDHFGKESNQRLAYRFHHGLEFKTIQAEKEDDGDSVVFYYAGHGQAGKFDEGPSGYLLPFDVSDNAEMDNKVPMEWVHEAMENLACKHTLLILDCCFAGKFRHAISKNRFFKLSERRPITQERFERFKRNNAWQVMVSAGPDETAADWMGDRNETEQDPDDPNENPQFPHSPFARALFKALDGEADFKHIGEQFGDGVLTATELKLYLYDQVERLTNKNPNFKIQHPDLFSMNKHDGGEFIFINPNAPQLKFAQWQHLNPYKGLMAYEAGDWPFFFGRKDATADIFKKLKDTPVLLISASSGLGKSSLVKAGIFPKLKNQGFQTYVFRPGINPWNGTKVTIPQNVENKQNDSTTKDSNHLTYYSGLKKLKSDVDQAEGLKYAILLDQYEELFLKINQDAEIEEFEQQLILWIGEAIERKKNRNAFEAQIQLPVTDVEKWNILISKIPKWAKASSKAIQKQLKTEMEKAAQGELSNLTTQVLHSEILQAWDTANGKEYQFFITLRSDFEWQFENSAVGKELENYAKILSEDNPYSYRYRPAPMSLDELRDALISPALIRGFEFESEELVGEILEEIGYAPAALPLLSLCMNRLFKIAEDKIKNTDKDKRIFSRTIYKEELGGISGALSKMADEFYASLNHRNLFDKMLNNELSAEEKTKFQDRISDEADFEHEFKSYKQLLLSLKDTADPKPKIWQSPKQKAMQKLFMRMLQLNDGEYSRRRIYYNRQGENHELDYPNSDFDALIGNLLNQMVKAQLVVMGEDGLGNTFIEPAHDTLLNHWSRCRKWIEEFGKENILLQRQLWQAIQDQRKFGQIQHKNDMRAEPQESKLQEDSLLWNNNPKLILLFANLLEAAGNLPTVSGSMPQKITTEGLFMFGLGTQHESALSEMIKAPEFKKLLTPEEEKTLEIFLNEIAIKKGNGSLSNAKLFSNMALTGKLILHLLENGDHWLNKVEKEFVLSSWEKRARDFENIIRQRDEAKKAEKKAKANVIAYMAENHPDRTSSFRLAEFASFIDPDNSKAMEQMLKAYYNFQQPTHYTFNSSILPFFSIDSSGIFASLDNHIFDYDADIGKVSNFWEASKNEETHHVALSSDGNFMAVASGDLVKIMKSSHSTTKQTWEPFNDCKIKIRNTKTKLKAIDFSKDGTKIFCSYFGYTFDKAELYIIENWKENSLAVKKIEEFESKWFHKHILSPDNSMILSINVGEIRNVDNAAILPKNKLGIGFQDGFFANDEVHVIAITADNKIWKWHISTGDIEQLLSDTDENAGGFFSLTPSSAMDYIAIGTFDGRAHIYDFAPESNEIGLRVYSGFAHQKGRIEVKLSPDMTRFLTKSSHSSTIKVWELGSEWKNNFRMDYPYEQNKWILATDRWYIDKVVNVPEHLSIIIVKAVYAEKRNETTIEGNERAFELFNFRLNKSQGIIRYHGHKAELTDAAISSDGKSLAIALNILGIGEVRLFDIENKLKSKAEYRYNQAISRVAFCDNDEALLLRLSKGVKKRKISGTTEKGKPKTTTVGKNDPESLRLHHKRCPNQRYEVIFPDRSGPIKVFELDEKDEYLPELKWIFDHPGIKSHLNSVQFFSDSSTMISIGDGTIKFWDLESGQQTMELNEFEDVFCGYLFDNDAVLMAFSQKEGFSILLNPNNLKETVNTELKFGSMHVEDIRQYDLNQYFEDAGFMDEHGGFKPLANRVKDERYLESILNFYQSLILQNIPNDMKEEYFKKVNGLYEEIIKRSKFFPKEIFSKNQNTLFKYYTEKIQPGFGSVKLTPEIRKEFRKRKK